MMWLQGAVRLEELETFVGCFRRRDHFKVTVSQELVHSSLFDKSVYNKGKIQL